MIIYAKLYIVQSIKRYYFYANVSNLNGDDCYVRY